MKAQRGFTLLELLIGMAVLGLILTLLFGGLRLATKSWDTGDKLSGDSAQLRAVQGFIRRELAQVFPLRWKNQVDNRLAFGGTPGAMKFVAPLPAQAGGGGLYLLGLELEDGDKGKRLVMKRAQTYPVATSFSSLEEGEVSVLAEHIDRLEFSYFGATTADGKAGWQEMWDDPQRLPLLVRIQVKTSEGRNWPDLVVPLMVEKSCGIWDSFHQRCVN